MSAAVSGRGDRLALVRFQPMRCGGAAVVQLPDGCLLELGDVFLPAERAYGSRPYRFRDFGPAGDRDKRVMTICTTAGCCGSCSFCSVRNSYRRKLSAAEIVSQVDFLLELGRPLGRAACPRDSEQFHVLYTRMGEPSFNAAAVLASMHELQRRYAHARFGLSTIGWRAGTRRLLSDRRLAPSIMLQFSMHATCDRRRRELLGIRNARPFLSLHEIAAEIRVFRRYNPRKVSLNFILLKGESYDFPALAALLPPDDVYIRLSPLNPTGPSARLSMSGLLQEEDLLAKSPVSGPELASVIRSIKAAGYSYALAPAIDEEIRHHAACGQALEMIRRPAQP